jgi:hypothetical protein
MYGQDWIIDRRQISRLFLEDLDIGLSLSVCDKKPSKPSAITDTDSDELNQHPQPKRLHMPRWLRRNNTCGWYHAPTARGNKASFDVQVRRERPVSTFRPWVRVWLAPGAARTTNKAQMVFPNPEGPGRGPRALRRDAQRKRRTGTETQPCRYEYRNTQYGRDPERQSQFAFGCGVLVRFILSVRSGSLRDERGPLPICTRQWGAGKIQTVGAISQRATNER